MKLNLWLKLNHWLNFEKQHIDNVVVLRLLFSLGVMVIPSVKVEVGSFDFYLISIHTWIKQTDITIDQQSAGIMSPFQFKFKDKHPQNILKDTRKLLGNKTNTVHVEVSSNLINFQPGVPNIL